MLSFFGAGLASEERSSANASLEAYKKAMTQTLPLLEPQFKNWMEQFRTDNAYEDILIIVGKSQGFLVYSFRGTEGIPESLESDLLKNTSLARLWDRVRETKAPVFVDFSRVGEPLNCVGAFLGAPVFSENQFCGVLVVQIGTGRLDSLLQSTGWIGKTGDAFLVGNDGFLRSTARSSDNSVLTVNVENGATRAAFQGEKGTGLLEDASGKPALYCWSGAALTKMPFLEADFDWAVITKIDEAEAFHRLAVLRQEVVIISAVLGILAALAGFFLARRLVRPITAMASIATNVSQGNLREEVPHYGRSDEIQTLEDAFRLMTQNLRNQTSMVLEGVKVLNDASSEILSIVGNVASSTDATAARVSENSTAVEELRQAAKIVSGKGKEVATISNRASEVTARGKTAVDDTVTGMAQVKDQMQAIEEIVTRLSDQSKTIQTIVHKVEDVADQSNLLAVNASIEAARAGDSGKGFSVVAHEIKLMADQSRKSTAEIKATLGDVQRWISNAVSEAQKGATAVSAGLAQASAAGVAIENLAHSVIESAEAASLIEEASAQQSAGSDQVSESMVAISEAMFQVTQEISRLKESAGRLGSLGNNLKDLMDYYRV